MEFQMTKPVGHSATITMVLICIFLMCMFLFLFLMFTTSGKYTLTVTKDTLTIQSLFYNTRILLSDVEADYMKMVNFDSLQINRRTNGMGMPGLSVGWFSGTGKKYKVYVTDKKNVLCIPTTKGYDILFSTTQGDTIMHEIKKYTAVTGGKY
jgi:hypothetical protein